MDGLDVDRKVATSAPGKVLFAGGYLVLDRQYSGLVLGLDARIHVLVRSATVTKTKPNDNLELAEDDEEDDEEEEEEGGVRLQSSWTRITVRSPQFVDARWTYDVRVDWDGDVVSAVDVNWVRPSEEGGDGTECRSPNVFVETTIRYVLSFLAVELMSAENGWRAGSQFRPVDISIFADEGYYSRPSAAATTTDDTADSRPFTDFAIPFAAANKTGLGSSAALVTALTSSLLLYHLPSTRHSSTLVHNLAQAAHCAAQGKIGSGFDIAAAVFGSCLYRRFSPTILESVPISTNTDSDTTDRSRFVDWVHSTVNGGNVGGDIKWDTVVDPSVVDLPSGFRLVMCDVDCGSKTPGMVRDVLTWRAQNESEATSVWDELESQNKRLRLALASVVSSNSDEEETEDVKEVADSIESIRSLVRHMSDLTGVPIEPVEQTDLLDKLTALDRVVGAVVPGAGGYDAVAVLVRGDQGVEDVRKFVSGYQFQGEKAGGKVTVLDASYDRANGLKIEDEQLYAGW